MKGYYLFFCAAQKTLKYITSGKLLPFYHPLQAGCEYLQGISLVRGPAGVHFCTVALVFPTVQCARKRRSTLSSSRADNCITKIDNLPCGKVTDVVLFRTAFYLYIVQLFHLFHTSKPSFVQGSSHNPAQM